MDGSRIGRGLRAIRIRANSTQKEVADGAKVPRAVIGSVERGDLARVRVEQLLAIAVALRADLDIVLRWNGTELDRLLNAGHSAMHELVVGILTAAGWEAVPERSFSIWGERGVIDLLAWHAATRSLLVVELKTEIVEVQRLIGTVDRYRRLAPQVVRDLGWEPLVVAVWVAGPRAPPTAAGWASMRASFALRSRPTVARSRAGCGARPAPSRPFRSYQMRAWRTVRQLGRRAGASGLRAGRSRARRGD